MVCIDLVVTRVHDDGRLLFLPSLLMLFLGCCFSACVAWRWSWWKAIAVSVLLALGTAVWLCIRSKRPAWATDSFYIPGGTAVALIGVAMNVIMTMSLEAALEWNIGWFILGWVVYFGYGIRHSKVGLPENTLL